MNVAILFSGGKDSTMAVYAALEAKEDVKYLLSMKSKNDESYMFHVPNIHVTDLLSEALDIPIMSVETDGVKEEELEDLKAAFLDLKDLGVEAIYTSALYSVYQKFRIEKLGHDV
jgi:predicted ATP pyrophosphatase (TIGR00289 family)